MKNSLEVGVTEFKRAIKIFAPKRRKLGPALLAFEGGFLSIESGEATAVMRATGEWQGRATFSPEILRAVATFPPTHNPILISYAENHLILGGMTIACQWHIVRDEAIEELENPSLLDLLAMERTAPRAEVNGPGIGKQLRSAKTSAERRIKKAAEQLCELGIGSEEIRALVETKITARRRE